MGLQRSPNTVCLRITQWIALGRTETLSLEVFICIECILSMETPQFGGSGLISAWPTTPPLVRDSVVNHC